MTEDTTAIVILAAGKGTRMNLSIPKVLAPVGGSPMLGHLLGAIEASRVDGKPIVVYGPGVESVCTFVGERGVCVLQKEQLGTGDALRSAREACGAADRVVVFYGDHPLVSAETIQKLVAYHRKKPSPILLAVGTVSSFDDWQSIFKGFGRIVRSEQNLIRSIREYKDATEEERMIREVNPGYYVFESAWLWSHIDRINNQNVQKEYYLTDLIQMAVDEGLPVRTYQIPIEECVGVNRIEEQEIADDLFTRRGFK